FPVRPITRQLSAPDDGVPISTERPRHALREAGRVSPHPPHALVHAHLIDARYAPLVGIEHGTHVRMNHVIVTDDTDSIWREGLIPFEMPEQEGFVLEPGEG